MNRYLRQPDSLSEAELQAYLWSEFQKRKINARCGYSLPSGVADFVIFDQGRIALVIELKSIKSTESRTSAMNQAERYIRDLRRSFEQGSPVISGIVIRGLEKVRAFLREIDSDGIWQFNGCIVAFWPEKQFSRREKL